MLAALDAADAWIVAGLGRHTGISDTEPGARDGGDSFISAVDSPSVADLNERCMNRVTIALAPAKVLERDLDGVVGELHSVTV